MKAEIRQNIIHLLIDRKLYNEEVLHKCFYWYGANFHVDIDICSEDQAAVQLEAKYDAEDLNATLGKIKRDLIDFRLRDIVTKETKTIRELIIAKAFAHYDTNENPASPISDPVGFSPENIKPNE